MLYMHTWYVYNTTFLRIAVGVPKGYFKYNTDNRHSWVVSPFLLVLSAVTFVCFSLFCIVCRISGEARQRYHGTTAVDQGRKRPRSLPLLRLGFSLATFCFSRVAFLRFVCSPLLVLVLLVVIVFVWLCFRDLVSLSPRSIFLLGLLLSLLGVGSQ